MEIDYVWAYFLELSSTRPIGYNGPLAITYQEIAAWKDLTETPLSPWEVEVIKRLDKIYMKVVSNGRS